MSKHWTWIVVVGLLAAATAFAVTTPAARDEPSAPAAAVAAPVLACPHDGQQPCNCQGENAGQEEQRCNGDGSCGCGRFVDENGDTVCDNRGQGGCGGGGQDQQQQTE